MKFFSKARHTSGNAEKSGQSASPAAPPDNGAQNGGNHPAQNPREDLPQAGAEASRPHTPLSLLAHKLGISPSVCEELRKAAPGRSADDNKGVFIDRLTDIAQTLLSEMDAAEKEAPDAGEASTGAHAFSSDMRLETYVTKDGLKAFGFIFPPIGGGKGLGFDQLVQSAKKDGIVSGIDKELLKKLGSDGPVMELFVLAEGKNAVDGTEGQVIELYSREKQISLTVDNDEIVDYKNLNWLQTVHKGDVICRIVPPVPAQDGLDVRGVAVKGREPKALRLPKGKNIEENADHTALVAEVDGYLTYLGGIFKVDQLLKIDGDVDSSIGNLDVIGSVNVRGCVTDGFTIRATGDILVSQSVAGAELIAGGNIKIVGGMNGSYKGKLTAGGSISCKYLENCSVTASGEVKSQSIINSTVVSGDIVTAKMGKGVIIGSTIISLKGVDVKVIGNERNLLSKITIGTDPQLSEELTVLEKEVSELRHKSEEARKNINYLTKSGSLTEKYQQLLEQLQKSYSEMNASIEKKTERIAVLEEELKGDSCQIIASQIFPPLTVTIGTVTQQFLTESRMSRIFKADGEIVLGKK